MLSVLRNYQQKAILDIKKAWTNKYKSPCLVAPCGAGKSIIVAELARLTTLETDAGPGAVLGDEVFREVTIDNAPQRKRELGIFRREKARRR